MVYNICKIKNIDTSDHSIMGTIISEDEIYTIPDSLRVAIANNSDILQKISEGKLQIGNDVEYFSNINDQINWLKSNTDTIIETLPFSAKVLQNGKKLFTRTHGKEFALSIGSNTLDFNIPYTQCKISGIEILNGEFGDKVDLFILDDDLGTYSTVPNYVLNQFGFETNIAKDFYNRESSYDADLYYNMYISITYYSESAKNIYINYLLHEVKD